jgi:hypothetical protein
MRRYRYWLLLLCALAVVVVGLAVYLPRESKPLLTSLTAWKRSGSVELAEPNFRFVFADGLDALYLVVDAKMGNGSAHIVSKPIEAPGWITLTVTGDLRRPGNEVYLQLAGKNRRIRIATQTEPFYWRRVTTALPSDWVGQPIELVVDAGPREPTNWFGISNPRALSSGTVLLSHLKALLAVPGCLLSLVLFLAPGLPLAARLATRGAIAPTRVVVVAAIFACLAGYLTFWAYFLSSAFGRWFGTFVLFGGLAWCVLDLRRGRATRSVMLSGDVTTPLALMGLVLVFYVSLWHCVNLWTPFCLTPRLRFLEFVLTIDNEIPYFFAERLYNAMDPRQLVGDWHSSDRPPLQAGIVLLQLPLGYLASPHEGWPALIRAAGRQPGEGSIYAWQPEVWSILCSCVLQCLWVPALWEFCTAAGLSRRRAGLALLLVTLTGFMLLNSVFTWPKMLAANLVVIAISLALFRPQSPEGDRPFFRTALWGMAAGLAFLAHGGVVFTLLPLGLILLIPRYFPGMARLAVAAAAFVVTVLPWSLYQKSYDPPGTELIRQHIAGRSPTWQDDRPLLANLADAYRGLSASQILANKQANMEVLFRASEHPADDQYPWPPYGSPKPWPVDAVSLRRCEFLCLFWAPGLLNLGWLWAALTGWRRPAPLNPVLGLVAPLLGLASALAWVLLMFGPGSTVVHQGSYATLLLLFVSLAAWIATMPGWLPYAILFGQGILFGVVWLFTAPANELGLVNPFMIVSALVSFVLLCRMALELRTSASTIGASERKTLAAVAKGA